jgi:hypothetical protein
MLPFFLLFFKNNFNKSLLITIKVIYLHIELIETKKLATMTVQDLKNHREQIIEFATFYQLDVNKFMSFLLEGVDFGLNNTENVMEYVNDSYIYTFRKTKINKVAESSARAIQEGRKDEFNLRNYLSNKNA